MVMLKSLLQTFQLSITMTKFQIQTPLQLNQLMMMKWIIYWKYSTHNMMTIFYMLTSRCFRLDWWSPLLQNFIQYLLCFFIDTEEWILQPQIVCHTFLWLSQPRPLWNRLTEIRDMPKELGLFYINLLTVWLYIQLNQFIIVQVTLP